MKVSIFAESAVLGYNLLAHKLTEEDTHDGDSGRSRKEETGTMQGDGAYRVLQEGVHSGKLSKVWEEELRVRKERPSGPRAAVSLEHHDQRGESYEAASRRAGTGAIP